MRKTTLSNRIEALENAVGPADGGLVEVIHVELGPDGKPGSWREFITPAEYLRRTGRLPGAAQISVRVMPNG